MSKVLTSNTPINPERLAILTDVYEASMKFACERGLYVLQPEPLTKLDMDDVALKITCIVLKIQCDDEALMAYLRLA